MEIAAEDVGDILGHPIRIIELDSECSNELGESMATRLAENQWLIGAVGATCGGSTYSAASVLSEEGMALITPSVSTAWLTDPEYHKAGFLRVIPNDLEQAELVAEFAFKELGARRMATIHEGSLYGEDLQIKTCEVFASLGGECVVQEEMEFDVTDLHGLLNKVAESSPDVIFVPVLMDSGAEILKVFQGMETFEEISLIGTNTFFSDDFLALAGNASEDHYFSGLMVGTDYYSYQYEQFLENYNAMYGTSPDGLYHAYGYDALLLLVKAIERAAVKDPDGTLHIPRQALRDALFASRYLQGLSGTLNCTSEGDCGDPNTIRILQIIDPNPLSFNPGEEEDSNPKVVYP
jgi:branched-chain amino acid transport system substrate-binding protein